jgi:hypothetical protein
MMYDDTTHTRHYQTEDICTRVPKPITIDHKKREDHGSVSQLRASTYHWNGIRGFESYFQYPTLL